VTSIAVIIGRCIAGCLGVILIYSALFLYKEEEGGLENRIEQWWQKIRDLHAHAISRETAFLKVVADVTSKGFAKLFGERLFGQKAVVASMCYSQAAVLLCEMILYLLYPPVFVITVVFYLATGTQCLVFLFLGSLGPFIDRRWQKRFWLLSVLIATAIWPLGLDVSGAPFGVFSEHGMYGITYYARDVAILLFSVVCDFLFIALTRVMLARAAESNSFVKITALAIGNACLAALLFIVPLVGSFSLRSWSSTHGWLAEVQQLLLFVGSSNFLDALVSLSWFLIAIMMLLHRLFWPLIERPVYAVFRYRVFSEQKKLVFFSGVALLGLAVPWVGRALENLVKEVRG
jgi:hypothetical protein